MRRAIGTPEMKATSFRDLVARTPTCHSFLQPGALSALGLSACFHGAPRGGDGGYQLRKDME